MSRCNCLCTKDATGTCALCEARAEADHCMWLLFKGGFLLNLLRFVRDRSKQFLFNRQSFVSLVHFYMVSIPVFAVRLALSLLCATTFYEFFYKGEFSSILTPYLAAIGASISLASATFSYARAITDKEEEETLISIGEYFLGTTVLLIFALLITWGGFQIQKFLEKISYYARFAHFEIAFQELEVQF